MALGDVNATLALVLAKNHELDEIVRAAFLLCFCHAVVLSLCLSLSLFSRALCVCVSFALFLSSHASL